MKPIEFPEQNIIMGKNQPQYQPLPAFKDENGTIVSCWELSPDEIKKVKKTGRIWLSQSTFKLPMQPIFLSAEKSDHLVTPVKFTIQEYCIVGTENPPAKE